MKKKLLCRVMRLLILFLTTGFLQLSAASYSQTITLKGNKLILADVFNAIQQQTGYRVFGDTELLGKAKTIAINAQNMPLETFLVEITKGQDLKVEIHGKNIVVSDRDAVPAAPGHATQSSLTGQLFNLATNEPIVSATVTAKGTKQKTVSDGYGRFTLNQIPDNATLIFTSMGFAKLEIAYASLSALPAGGILTLDGGKVTKVKEGTYNFYLSSQTSDLDEVQVIGYGTTSRRISTGNVSSVTAADIEKQPVTNVLEALSGKVPGLLITQQSGTPGGGVSVQIRAASSISAGTTPLFIVDGVPFVSDPLYSTGGNTVGYLKPSFGSSPLNTINPVDIESISVLKDADATALYGSRGANGVILITTKRGKGGKSNLDVNVSEGFNSVQNLHAVKSVTLPQYLEIRRQAFINSGKTPDVNNAPDLLVWDTTKTTDWQKLLFGGTAHNTDANLSFSGGNEYTNFLLSGTYHNEGQVIPGDFNYKRGAFHMAIDHQSKDKKFGLNTSVMYTLDKNSSSARTFQSSDLAGVAYSQAPNYPLYDSTGSLYWYNANFNNPLAYTNEKFSSANYNLVGNVILRYSPIAGLNLKVSSSYNRLSMYQKDLHYSTSINPFYGQNPGAYFQENYTNAWNVEPQADYTQHIGKGKLNVLIGGTLQGQSYNQPFYIVASNYNSDFLLNNYTAAGNYNAYSFNSDYKYSSLFSRLNYNWLDKYILNVNYRWDASSKFGVNNRYGSFASVGAAWIFTEENGVKEGLSWLSFGKLRGSYGSTGNDQISNYQYYDTYTIGNSYDGVNGLTPSNVANPNLKWEVNKKLELGLNLGFLKDRILVSGVWFLNRTSNPLVSYPLAALSGFSSYTANMPATIQSTGSEFELTTQNIKAKNFSWTTAFNISFAQTKLKKFDGIEKTGYVSSLVVGESMSSIHMLQYTGIDANTGLPGFLDANNDGVKNWPGDGLAAYGNGDDVTVGKRDPAFFGGINNSFHYKSFQLDIFGQFVGRKMIPGIRSSAFSDSFNPPGYSAANMYGGIYDLYKETNGKIATTKFDFSEGSPFLSYYMYTQSSATISNAAYFRLKNVALSYTFPQVWSQKLKIAALTLYARAQNLFTISNFEGYDPETEATNIPPLRTITFGLKCSL